MQFKKAIFLSVLSGVFLGISFDYADQLWFLSLVALVPFLHVIYTLNLSKKQIFLFSWLLGFVFMGMVLAWVWETLPLTSLGISNVWLSLSFVFFHWSLPVLTLSLFIGVWGVLVFCIKNRTVRDIFAISFLWVALEYARMWGYALLTLGDSSLFGPHFSIGFIGYELASNYNFLQMGSVGGVYMLSFVVIACNSLVYYIIYIWNVEVKRKIYVAVALSSLVIVFAYFPYEKIFSADAFKKNRSIRIAVAHTDFPSSLSVSYTERQKRQFVYGNLVKETVQNSFNPEVIILPEDSRFLQTLGKDKKLKRFLAGTFGGKEVLLIDSGRYVEMDGARSRIHFFNTKDQTETSYDKIFLAASGEYTPYFTQGLLQILKRDDVLQTMKRKTYAKGKKLKVGVFKGVKVGALFCSEVYSASLYRSLVRDSGADILVNLSSQSRFHGSRILYRQNVNVAKVHAVQNNRYYVQATNVAPSFVLDNKGRLVAESGWGKASILYANVGY